AMKIASRWAEPAVAKLYAARLTNRDESYEASQLLRVIARDGRAALVEDAILPLLGSDDFDTVSSVRALTEEFGSAKTVAELTRLSNAAPRNDQKKQYQKWIAAVKKARGEN
ncbi:MAG: hypothetical protein ACRCZF_15860, partial [Gemmataceae bacterium]